MRSFVFLAVIAIGLSSVATAQQPTTPPAAASAVAKPKEHDPQRQCVGPNEFINELRSGLRPVGESIVIDTNFLPTGQHVDVGIRAKYADGTRYFVGIDRDDGHHFLLRRQDVLTRRATDADALVKKHLLERDETLVTLTIPDTYAGIWAKVDLYLYTCSTLGSPAKVSRDEIRLSPHSTSLWVCLALVFFFYFVSAMVFRRRDHTIGSFLSRLNPVTVSVGPDGKASLSTFQVWLFTLAVVGLFLLFWLQTGMLADLSGTILTLLGISGIGAIAAKGTDQQRNTISPENRAWLIRKNWIQAAKQPVDASNATWRDFFTTNGQFDVYRYQSFVFSFVVVAALIAAGVTELSTFTIPDTVLGIVGLSQVVYIGGKLVTSTSMSDLNAALNDLRDKERKFRDDATAKKGSPVANVQEAVQFAGQQSYDAYKDKAKDVAAIFTAETGITVGSAALDPTLD